MIKAIIFDWGGVLAPCDNIIAATRLKKTFEFNENTFIKYYDEHEDNFVHTNEYKEFFSIISKKFNIPVGPIMKAVNVGALDENFEIAQKLSKKYKIYLLSNQIKFKTDYIRNTFDLNFFDKVFFSNEVGLKKPSEEIFQFILKKITQKPEDCIFTDDNLANITAAKKLEFSVILFKDLFNLKKDLATFSIDID